MTNSIKSDDKKPFIPKKPSSFNNDPYNNRSGGKGNKGGAIATGGSHKPKSFVPKVTKGGSSGDR